MIKRFINWLVFAISIYHSLWACHMLFGIFFVLGDNDTLLGVVGVLVMGLSAIPGSLLALRHRRLAAIIFFFASSLWIVGAIDSERYLAKQMGSQIVPKDLLLSLIKTTSVPLFLALFNLLTDMLKWPVLLPRQSSKDES